MILTTPREPSLQVGILIAFINIRSAIKCLEVGPVKTKIYNLQ